MPNNGHRWKDEELTGMDFREDTENLAVNGLADGEVMMQESIGLIGADSNASVIQGRLRMGVAGSRAKDAGSPVTPTAPVPHAAPAQSSSKPSIAEDEGAIRRKMGIDYTEGGTQAAAPEPDDGKGKKKKEKNGIPLAGKIAIGATGVLVAGLVAGWAYGRSWYSEHLFPGVSVDGVAVGNMTPAEAREATSVERWSFVVKDRDESYTLDAKDVDFQTEEVDYDKLVSNQDVNLWFAHVIAPDPNETVRQSTYNEDTIAKSVHDLPCVSGERQDPVDATFRRSEDGKAFEVVPEVEGTRAKGEVIESAVKDALEEGRSGSIDLDEADAYLHPSIYSNDKTLVEAVETANRWMRTDITYDIDGLTAVERLGPDTIAPWVNIVCETPVEDKAPEGEEQSEEETPKPEGEATELSSDSAEKEAANAGSIRIYGARSQGQSGGGMLHMISDSKDVPEEAVNKPEKEPTVTFKATFDDAGLRGWLAGIGEEYDTAGKPRTITTPNGEVKEVNGGGAYGWITDEASEFEAIKASIEAGETTQREFAMKQRAALPKGQNEWGNTYIEIDLTDQHLWYIRNGEVILSYGVITGKRGYETPTMVSQVYAKQTDVTLVSPWKDPKTGEPTYKTHIDVGLVISDDYQVLCHDAPWQPSSGFGNPSYHWSGGSHGCCNMKASQCWELYNTASVGDPVIVHY